MRAFPLARKRQGSIVFFASAAALPGARIAEMSAYAASKAGVVTLMRAIAQEERDTVCASNALAPTSIRTATNLEAMGTSTRYVERGRSRMPSGFCVFRTPRVPFRVR